MILRRIVDRLRAPGRTRDWPGLGRYRAANAAVTARPRAVFLGDSITQYWVGADPGLFADGVIGRGIGGQTTPQILLRFMADVVALRPRCVHILAGTNDIAGNTGPTTVEDVLHHITAMILLAEAHDIRVILGNLAPYRVLPWAPGVDPVPWVARINAWLRETARARGHIHADYHAVLAAGDGSVRRDLVPDGVHPSVAGYRAMRPVADAALARALDPLAAQAESTASR